MGHDTPNQVTTAPRSVPELDRPTRVRYLVLAVACSLAVLTYVQRQGLVAGTPYIKADLRLHDEQMGYLAAAWLIAYGLFQVPCGLLGDRLGARNLLTILVVGWSVLTGVTALAAFLPPGGLLAFVFLLAVRFLFALFQAGGFPVLARVLADWMPAQRRGFAQGLVWTFSRLGGFAAPILFLWLYMLLDRSWAIPFCLLGSLGLLWCVFFWPWFRNRPDQMCGVNDAERELIAAGRPLAPPRPVTLDGARFFRSINVWALCLMYGFVGFAGNFITSLLPIYLRDHLHLNDQTTAWLSGLPLACGIVSCLMGGVVSDWLILRCGSRKWGRRLVGSSVLVLAAVSALTPLWVHDVWLLALAFSAMFFFNDATMGPAWASCADIGEQYAGTLSGAMNMTGGFLGAAGMAFAGWCFRREMNRTVFIAFACSYALAALCWLVVDVTKPLVPRVE